MLDILLRIRRLLSDVSVEVSAYMDAHFVIRPIFPFAIFILCNDNVHCYPFAEIVHDEPCEDLLEHIVWLSRVEVGHPNSIFQLSERSFYAPSLMI